MKAQEDNLKSAQTGVTSERQEKEQGRVYMGGFTCPSKYGAVKLDWVLPTHFIVQENQPSIISIIKDSS